MNRRVWGRACRVGYCAKVCGLAVCALFAASGVAEVCTTQSRMDAGTRAALTEVAARLGSAVQAGNAAAVRAATTPDLAGNFDATEQLIRSTADKLKGDSLLVSQLYLLDATTRKPGDTASAEFSCALQGAGAETDFSIGGLPQGTFAFAMVEASGGAHPYLLSMVLQKTESGWKLAGFYPKARTAAGHSGVWFWAAARERATAKEPLLAWLYYAEAAALLQPAPFVSSSNLDKLTGEQRTAGPPQLVNGASAESPLPVAGAGTEYRFTALSTAATDDDRALQLIAHVAEDPGASPDAIQAHSTAAGQALLKSHPELQQAYSSVLVFADGPQGNPPVVTLPTR